LSIQLEWRLSAVDVALLLGVTRQAVHYYTMNGRGGFPLVSRQWGMKGSKRCYRLGGVENFALAQRWVVQYDTLPLWVQKEWRVGDFSPDNEPYDATHVRLANIIERKDTP
jgi:hypothetical protein